MGHLLTTVVVLNWKRRRENGKVQMQSLIRGEASSNISMIFMLPLDLMLWAGWPSCSRPYTLLWVGQNTCEKLADLQGRYFKQNYSCQALARRTYGDHWFLIWRAVPYWRHAPTPTEVNRKTPMGFNGNWINPSQYMRYSFPVVRKNSTMWWMDKGMDKALGGAAPYK